MERNRFRLGIALIMGLVVSACGGGAATTTTTAASTTTTTTAAPAATTTAAPNTGEITFDAPPSVEAGTEFEVSWTGPNNTSDYITIVPVGADEGSYQSYFNTASGPTGKLVAPLDEGEYDIRYVDGISAKTAGSTTVMVTPYKVTLDAPPEVGAGTEFDVSWTGPNGPSDYITVVVAGADEGAYESYFNTASGPKGTLVSSMKDGNYEIRYVNGREAVTMGSKAIIITPLNITLEAPASVKRGTEFEVTWTGPDGPSDYLTIVEAGADDTAYLDYAYTRDGSPVKLTAPDAPGEYEIRYRSDRVAGVFATIPINVT